MLTLSVDLHVHTTASDGSEEPKEVVRQAALLGLRAVAITDHDTVRGVEEGLSFGTAYSVEVVPGVEINTDFNAREAHVLGYYVDFKNQAFLERLNSLANARTIRIEKMVARLQSIGLPITMADVLREAGDGTLGRPHVAASLVRLGIVASADEAFERFIGRNRPGYVPRSKFAPQEAVELILEAGGVPVLAHPGTVGDDRIIECLMEAGLKGLEVYHPDHDEKMVEHYLAIARSLELLVTGGSDYHGRGYHACLGGVTVPYSVVKALQQARQV
ncbi:MAG: PHP domain-containing protein [Bacillota bacterium]